MTHNDADDYAQRLYARVPGHYRVYDAELGQPLLALLRVVGEQVANVREDLDVLWDNFFIETCADWVVPYIGALAGTNLLAHPVGQSSRLDVWNTIRWRRSKGTPAMLQDLAQAISGWPTDLAEFFQALGWSQNMNHLRLDHPLTPDLRDPYQLSLLGHAADPFARAADFKPAYPLDEARTPPAPPLAGGSTSIGRAAWGTPGRYQIKNLGFFVRRLQTFALAGVAPATVAPGATVPPDAACFTFDPLFQNTPLFIKATGMPLTRAAFAEAPGTFFGQDVGVRQFGVLLATPPRVGGAGGGTPSPDAIPADDSPRSLEMSGSTPTQVMISNQSAFTFGGAGAGLALDATAGMRLLASRPGAGGSVAGRSPLLQYQGGAHFVITAGWLDAGGTVTALGRLSTLHVALGDADAYHPGAAAPDAGQLVVTVQTGRAGLGWPGMPPAPAARFPGAVLAVRAARTGAFHAADTLYVSLPSAFIQPTDTPTYYVADDGSTYVASVPPAPQQTFDPTMMAQAANGPIYPAATFTASTAPANEFTVLNRKPGGLRVADPARFGNAGVLIEVSLFTGTFQTLGAVATIDQPAGDYPDLAIPDPWPAFTYGPSNDAVNNNLPSAGLLSVLLKPLPGNDFVPQTELIVVNRLGQSLLVYLPEVSGLGSDGLWLFVADDGSTYIAPPDNADQMAVLSQGSYSGLMLARAGGGQVLPIPGVWPIQQRVPVSINLCDCRRSALLQPGELGIDPELGRFALAPGDPAIGQGGLSVDYVEAFSDRVGARTFDRQLDPSILPTRLVAQSGDAASESNPNIANDHLHASVADALAAAQDGDVIEIVDSATYAATAPISVPATVQTLTLRAAAGQRPCLTFYQAENTPTAASLEVNAAMNRLELSGLLMSGGPIQIASQVQQLLLSACTLDPRSAGTTGSLVATDANLDDQASYLLCRCITGGVYTAAGISQLTIADSIVDAQGTLAIGGPPPPAPPASGGEDPKVVGALGAAQGVQLERVTVLGWVRCVTLTASECLLNDLAIADDQQAGCIRFSRYELGSVLPRRYQCIPSDTQAGACASTPPSLALGPPAFHCLAPLFNSRHFGRPDYCQLAADCPLAILTASEAGAEVGAFASRLNTIRLANLNIKLQEFLPVGLTAVVIAET
jgi:hypothetical protein